MNVSPPRLYQRVIRNRESRDNRDNREITEKKVIPDFVVVSSVSVVSIISLLRITLNYVILIPLYTHGRTVIYIGKTSDRPLSTYNTLSLLLNIYSVNMVDKARAS